jgi:hypothetical protein
MVGPSLSECLSFQWSRLAGRSLKLRGYLTVGFIGAAVLGDPFQRIVVAGSPACCRRSGWRS